MLVLSLCAIGSLFVGTIEGDEKGHHIFHRVQRAILADWESHYSANEDERFPMVQAALLCQIFGSLSFEPSDNIMADSLHGTVVAWAQMIGAFGVKEDDFWFKNTFRDERSAAWQEWIHREQYRRLAMALYIQDANMATRHNHDPLLRHFAIHAKTQLDEASTSLYYLRCLFHACMLLERAESIGLRDTPAIHVPQAIFYASMALICHTSFLQPRFQLSPHWREEVMRFPEVHAMSKFNADRVPRTMKTFPNRLSQDDFEIAY